MSLGKVMRCESVSFCVNASRKVMWFSSLSSKRQIREADTVAFLPTAGIFRNQEFPYLTESKWSGREDLNLRPPGPEPGAQARDQLNPF
jgi:hypothetical protein